MKDTEDEKKSADKPVTTADGKQEEMKSNANGKEDQKTTSIGGVHLKILPYSTTVLNVYEHELDTFDGATGQALLKYDVSFINT